MIIKNTWLGRYRQHESEWQVKQRGDSRQKRTSLKGGMGGGAGKIIITSTPLPWKRTSSLSQKVLPDSLSFPSRRKYYQTHCLLPWTYLLTLQDSFIRQPIFHRMKDLCSVECETDLLTNLYHVNTEDACCMMEGVVATKKWGKTTKRKGPESKGRLSDRYPSKRKRQHSWSRLHCAGHSSFSKANWADSPLHLSGPRHFLRLNDDNAHENQRH